LYLVSEINHDWRFLRSVDEGASWQEINFDAEVRDFSLNSLGHIFVSTSQYLYRSTDDGETWDLLEHMDDEIYIEKLAISSNDAILIKTRDTDYFMVSHDNGDTWTILDKLDDNLKFIKADDKGNFYYVAWKSDLMRYRWVPSESSYVLEDVTPGSISLLVLSLYIKPDNDLFVSTTEGLLHSSDDGLTWTDFYSETVSPNSIFSDMAFAPESGYLYGAHSSTGVWRIAIGIETDVRDITVKDSPTLSVFPNPAIGRVTISNNDLANDNDIITMYDQAGSVIRQVQMVNSTATLSMEGIQPGVYILRSSKGTGIKIVVK
jgi:hypothetical protein